MENSVPVHLQEQGSKSFVVLAAKRPSNQPKIAIQQEYFGLSSQLNKKSST